MTFCALRGPASHDRAAPDQAAQTAGPGTGDDRRRQAVTGMGGADGAAGRRHLSARPVGPLAAADQAHGQRIQLEPDETADRGEGRAWLAAYHRRTAHRHRGGDNWRAEDSSVHRPGRECRRTRARLRRPQHRSRHGVVDRHLSCAAGLGRSRRSGRRQRLPARGRADPHHLAVFSNRGGRHRGRRRGARAGEAPRRHAGAQGAAVPGQGAAEADRRLRNSRRRSDRLRGPPERRPRCADSRDRR